MNAENSQRSPSVPTIKMGERACRTCRFFDFEGEDRSVVEWGECRRHAPTARTDGGSAASEVAAVWPFVRWCDWCGEWEEGVSTEMMMRLARNEAVSHTDSQDAAPGWGQGR